MSIWAGGSPVLPSVPQGVKNFFNNSQFSGAKGNTLFTDPNPLTGYLAKKVGFDPSHPIQSLTHLFGTDVAGPPGVAGPADPSHVPFFQRTPDGKYIDPVNGQTYADANGQVPVGNVNSAQQTGADFGTSNGLLGGMADLHNRMNATFGSQNDLAGSLNSTITGRNPSVALAQLGEGQDAIARQQLAGAAGATGVNAVNAKLSAMGNTANAEAMENQSQALLRAQEVAAAQQNLGALYNSQLGAENTGMGTFASTAANYANTAAKLASDREKADLEAQKANAEQNKNMLGTIGGGLTKLASM